MPRFPQSIMKRGVAKDTKITSGNGGWQFIFRHSQRVGVACGLRLYPLPAFGLINNFSFQIPKLCKIDKALPPYPQERLRQMRRVEGGGWGAEFKYSQFPLYTPRLHCAQAMRKYSQPWSS